jgi:serine/threonine protein kinase
LVYFFLGVLENVGYTRMGCGASKDGVQIPKRTLSSRYLVQQELSAGSFGACYYATTVRNGVPCKDEQSGFAVAIKKIDSSDPKFKYAKVAREVRVMRMLKHTRVVRLLDYLEHKDAFYVVLEFVAGGDLFDRITLRGAMPECVGAFVTCQVLDALVYMHANGESTN